MIRKIFFTGLAALVPLVITVYVLVALFSFAEGILGEYVNSYLRQTLGYTIPGLAIILTLLIIFFVGLFVQMTRMRVLRFVERMVFRIPLVNKIYFPVRRIVDFLFFSPQKAFKSAVLIEYPRKGMYALGFLTNRSGAVFEQKTGRKMYNVFISSSPSPLTGFTVIVDAQDIIPLDIGVDEAVKLIVSGGLLNPSERYEQQYKVERENPEGGPAGYSGEFHAAGEER
ncbi:MAG: DUF502 domain-containing protein [Candidatus Omnitrophica bacterium]|nr:DUF502 domain-containing protein [Candidatus Omnitrophota bacterium]